MSASPHNKFLISAQTNEQQNRPAAVLLVDDHDLFRAGLRTLLEGKGVRIVGDSRCDKSAIEMCRRTRATVVLIDTADAQMKPSDKLVEGLIETSENVGVAMFTRSTEPADLLRSIRAGARGYINKNMPVEGIYEAIKLIHYGHGFIQPESINTLLGFIRTGRYPLLEPCNLSDRELDVLRLIAGGLDNNEISVELEISAKTVKNHVSSILMKLNLPNRVQAAVFAIRSGLA